MSGKKVVFPGHGWMDTVIESYYACKGHEDLSITNFDNTERPQIKAGSSIEVDGSLVIFPTDTDIDNWGATVTEQDLYIKISITPEGAKPTFTTEVPTWNSQRGGFYIPNTPFRCARYGLDFQTSAAATPTFTQIGYSYDIQCATLKNGDLFGIYREYVDLYGEPDIDKRHFVTFNGISGAVVEDNEFDYKYNIKDCDFLGDNLITLEYYNDGTQTYPNQIVMYDGTTTSKIKTKYLDHNTSDSPHNWVGIASDGSYVYTLKKDWEATGDYRYFVERRDGNLNYIDSVELDNAGYTKDYYLLANDGTNIVTRKYDGTNTTISFFNEDVEIKSIPISYTIYGILIGSIIGVYGKDGDYFGVYEWPLSDYRKYIFPTPIIDFKIYPNGETT